MATNWTKAQMNAICAQNKRILVSAAAGSGKTATLIERIIRSLTEGNPPMSLDRMLIVTFTKAAASELKIRIMSALNKAMSASPNSKHLKHQLLLLESAEICTIDSFCLSVLKKEFQNSNKDVSLRIGDENELGTLRLKAMDLSLENVLRELKDEGKEEACLEFFSVLCGPRKDKELSEKLLSVHALLKNTKEGIELIKQASLALENDASSGEINDSAKKIILAETGALFEHTENIISGYIKTFADSSEINEKYGSNLSSDLNFCKKIRSLIKENDYFSVKELLSSFKFSRLGTLKEINRTPQSDSFVLSRNKYRKLISTLEKTYYQTSKEDIKLVNEKSSDFLAILYRVLSSYTENYAKAKNASKIIEFDDLKTGVFKLFRDKEGKPTPLALEYSSKYDIIYIDEYQDVDPIQDSIFDALAQNSCLFTVGDIKQSIYGFRGSDPSIFASLRKSYSDYALHGEDAENATVYMSNNFRCARPIINASNFVCSHLFNETNSTVDSVGYRKQDDLVFSKEEPQTPSSLCEFVAVEQAQSYDNDKRSKNEAEIKYIASRILEIIEKEKKEDGHGFSYADFAVLCDKNSQVKEISYYFKKIGLPCDDTPESNFFSSPEILLVRSLLSSINNPFSDIHLASVLLSPLFSFSDGELLRIKKVSEKHALYEAVCEYSSKGNKLSDKCNKAISFLSHYGKLAQKLSIDEFMTVLWKRVDISAIAAFSTDDGRSENMKRENIDKLYKYASEYSSASFKTLNSFLSFLDEIINANPSSQILISSQNEISNKIHVMTMHRSKGLEFPVCFIFGTGSSVSGKPHDSEVVFTPESGICFDPAAMKGLVRIISPYKKAALSRIKCKQISEKIRLLYVAMTRAKEKLIITATKTSSFIKALDKYPPSFSILSPYINTKGSYPIINTSSYGEWILQCDPFAKEESNMIFKEVHENDIKEISIKSENNEKRIEDVISKEEKDELYKRFAFSYTSASSLLPSKIAVSDLTPTLLDKVGYNFLSNDSSLDFDEKPWIMLGSKAASGADKGTATHLFLQFADFEEWISEGTDAEINHMTERGFILPEHAEIIKRDMLNSFLESDFFKKIISSARLLREQRFNLSFPAHFFTQIPERKVLFMGEDVLVQGVIDLVLWDENGRMTLVDYKTDYVSEKEKTDSSLLEKKFNQRYSTQLSYYSLACEKLFGKKPENVIIYSLAAEKEIKIAINELC